MQPLHRDLRRKLETTVQAARDTAEAVARAALDQLGVGEPKAYAWLSDAQRDLRRRLRAHGRQLGDARNPDTESQAIDLLTQEVAYQHWHRMLFARWLAENHLLMVPDPVAPVAVTLEECAELAAEEGAGDAWELAARFASHMLPQIFRPTSPVFQLTLPPEAQQALERLVEGLDPAVFQSSDGLGWVYQFWQSKQKEVVNKSEVKIGARELPAVTQLFTEPYMVSFLLDNALGAWWVGKRCGIGRLGDFEIGDWRLEIGGERGLSAEELKAREMLQTATSEQELRDYFSLPGVPLTYLRFVREEIGDQRLEIGDSSTSPISTLQSPITFWRPAAGWFTAWPRDLAALKVLDPCCGSGHFLVAVFAMLVAMRMALEGLDARAAGDAVLAENIHGLEIDARCVEIAAFALALAAWRYPGAAAAGRGGYRPLPALNLACSGLAISARKEEWLDLARQAADVIVVNQAPALLPDLDKESLWHTQLKAGMGALYDLFQDAPVLGSLINPSRVEGDWFRADYGQVATLLHETLAAEDAPSRTPTVREGGEAYELGVVAQGLAQAATLLAGKYHWVVTNVPYLVRGKQDEKLRDFCEMAYPDSKQDLATTFLERCLEFCGSHGATSSVLPQNWLFMVSYKNLRRKLIKNVSWRMLALLGSGAFETISGEVVKAVLFCGAHSKPTSGRVFHGIDVSAFGATNEKSDELTVSSTSRVGQLRQLDNPDHVVTFNDSYMRSAGALLEEYAECYQGLRTGDMNRFVRGFWELPSVEDDWELFQTSSNDDGSNFSGYTSVIFWEKGVGQLHSYALINRDRLHDMHESGNRSWNQNGIAVGQITLRSTAYLGNKYDNPLAVITPRQGDWLAPIFTFIEDKAYSDLVREINRGLYVTNAALLKVPFDIDHWTRVAAERYPDGLPKPYSPDPTQWLFHGHPADSTAPLQVAVARLLGYRWPAETDDTMELSDAARAWVARSTDLLPYADKDGIVCLPPVRGEFAAAERLTSLLVAAYGAEWHAGKLDELLAAAGWAGKSLASWLRDQFFADHCKLFHQRPFIWHVWDGLADGFAALVNYHKLDRKNLETLIYTYLGDWIIRQRRDLADGVEGAASRLAAAEMLKQRLELILAGEAPYDIFVRWKPLAQQPVGWEPDLNDGVRLNTRPWLSVPDVGKKGAGVLRDKPNIKWEKDRGKDVASAPWFGVFGGERINDHHLTVAEKRAGRAG